MSRAKILVHHDDLERFVAAAFAARGMANADARIIAGVLVWANLRGGDSHGVVRVPRYLEMIEAGDMDPKARPHFDVDAPARFVLDARRAAGAVAMTHAIAVAIERAKTAGVCVGVVHHTTHTGAIGHYAQTAAERGCAAIIAAAGVPLMAYHGAKVRSLSTSPLAIATPTATRGPLVLDMATSVAAMGRLNQARASGDPIPAGWALAEDGTPTTDPARAAIPLPIAGPKGSGLALMFELLTGVLGGAPALVPALGAERRRRHIQNVFMLVADIGAFRDPAAFGRDADELVDVVKHLPARDGVDEILLPGERSRRTEAARRAGGIPIPPKTWDALSKVAGTLALKMPATLSAAEHKG